MKNKILFFCISTFLLNFEQSNLTAMEAGCTQLEGITLKPLLLTHNETDDTTIATIVQTDDESKETAKKLFREKILSCVEETIEITNGSNFSKPIPIRLLKKSRTIYCCALEIETPWMETLEKTICLNQHEEPVLCIHGSNSQILTLLIAILKTTPSTNLYSKIKELCKSMKLTIAENLDVFVNVINILTFLDLPEIYLKAITKIMHELTNEELESQELTTD